MYGLINLLLIKNLNMIKLFIGFIVGIIVASVGWVAIGLLTSVFQRAVVTPNPTQILGEKLVSTEWVFKSDHAKSDAVQTIKFTNDGKVSGTTACNSFGGSYTFQNNTIEIGPLASTEKACVDESRQDDEDHLLSHLDEIGKFAQIKIDGDTLTLTAGEESITFKDVNSQI